MGRTILVVDDNLDSILIMRSMLESRDFAVRVAQSGAEALAELEREVPDLVLLDVMMPAMNGFELLERLKGSPATAKVPVIMVTAKMQDEDLLTGYQHGADYYITKPCTAKQLIYGIELVLGRAEEPAASNAKDETA